MSKQEAIKAFDDFKKSAFALYEALYRVQSDDVDIDFHEDYPFQLSFDEMIHEIATWVDTQTGLLETKPTDIDSYRKYNPNVESIIETDYGDLIVITRYGVDDYGAWWTDEEHLYDDTYGSSVRGSFESIQKEINDYNKGGEL